MMSAMAIERESRNVYHKYATLSESFIILVQCLFHWKMLTLQHIFFRICRRIRYHDKTVIPVASIILET